MVALRPWQIKGDPNGYTGSEEWPTFREPICPVCYMRIARAIDNCYSGLFGEIWHWFFYRICVRYKFFRCRLRPALREEAQP